MRFVSSAALLWLLGAAEGRFFGSDGTLQLDIVRRNDLPASSRLRRRYGSTVSASLFNNITDGSYVTTVKVGTPPQTLTLQVDTGSSDTWVPSNGASICEAGGCFYGSFDASQSSTFQEEAPDFMIRYGDNTSASGEYFKDAFSIGAGSLKDLVMGLANHTDNPYGLVGVGLTANEAIDSVNASGQYPNLPVQMVTEGLIASTAYSLWLNDLDASTGSILFGGVDEAKYHGGMTRVRMYPDSGQQNITEFNVALTSVTAVSPSGADKLGSSSFPMLVLLDAGSTACQLPQDLVNEIYREAGVQVDSQGNVLIPCKFAQAKGYFSFGFGGPGGAVVNVSMSELVRPSPGSGTFSSGQYSGQEICEFDVFPAQDGSSLILGDSFLRGAYVVYDLDNYEIGLANTNFNTTSSNIVAFPSSSATIPSSTPAPSQDADSLSSVAITSSPATYAAASSFTQVSAANPARCATGISATALIAGMLLLVLVSPLCTPF